MSFLLKEEKIVMEEIYKYAKRYVEMGWSLLPMQFMLDEKAEMVKRPMVKWKELQERRASWPEVESWLNKGWFLGLITGKLSGLVVIDDDRGKHGLPEYGFSSFVVAKTKSGGKHFYFKYSEGITNTANEDLHVDVRGEGGYVVLPPFNGYEWIMPPKKENLDILEPIPESIRHLIFQDRGVDGKRTEPIKLGDIVGTAVGGRDNTLLSYANSLCNRFSKADWPNIFPLLVGMNNTFPEPLLEADVRRIFKQATNFVTNNPKTPYKKPTDTSPVDRDQVVQYSKMSDEKMKEREKRPRMKLGLPKLDAKFDWPTGYYVICANPGAGKGFFALWLSRKFWENGQKKSIYFSLEMGEPLVRNRIMQAWSDLSYEEFEKGADTTKAVELMKQDVISVYPFGQKDSRYQTPENFVADFEQLYDRGYRVFHFDHFHEIEGANTNDTNQSIVEKWGKAFQLVMKNPKFMDVWLFVFAQPNGSAAEKMIIRRSDIAGSKAITQKCEFFISLNRPQKINDKKEELDIPRDQERKVLFWIDKNRVSTAQYTGEKLYFSENGNFYEAKEDEKLVTAAQAEVESKDVEAWDENL